MDAPRSSSTLRPVNLAELLLHASRASGTVSPPRHFRVVFYISEVAPAREGGKKSAAQTSARSRVRLEFISREREEDRVDMRAGSLYRFRAVRKRRRKKENRAHSVLQTLKYQSTYLRMFENLIKKTIAPTLPSLSMCTFTLRSSAPAALRCDTATRENEVTRSDLQSSSSSIDWSENSKKRRLKIKSPRESERIGSQDGSGPARKFDKGGRAMLRHSRRRSQYINHETELKINKTAKVKVSEDEMKYVYQTRKRAKGDLPKVTSCLKIRLRAGESNPRRSPSYLSPRVSLSQNLASGSLGTWPAVGAPSRPPRRCNCARASRATRCAAFGTIPRGASYASNASSNRPSNRVRPGRHRACRDPPPPPPPPSIISNSTAPCSTNR